MEYVVITRWGDVVAGPFLSEDEARHWILNSYHGRVTAHRFGPLHVAARPAAATAPPIPWLCIFNSPGEVPAAVWDLQRSGDLVVVCLPFDFVGVVAVFQQPETVPAPEGRLSVIRPEVSGAAKER